jgi:hypothetical protein
LSNNTRQGAEGEQEWKQQGEYVLTNNSIVQTTRHLVAGCSLTLLIATGGGAALAHRGGPGGSDHVGNGGDHSGSAGHGRCIDCGGSKWTSGGSRGHGGEYHHHHHHHHHPTMTSDGPPLHGPGSSHNPIVYHPVHGPGSSHNPIVVSKPGNGMAPGTVVRDHRNGKNCWYVVGAGGVISDSTCPHGGHR